MVGPPVSECSVAKPHKDLTGLVLRWGPAWGALKDSARRPFQGPIRPPIVNSTLSEEEGVGDIRQPPLVW
jgi:hypothetical protein